MSYSDIFLSEEQYIHEVDDTDVQFGCKRGVCGQCVVLINDDSNILSNKCEYEKMTLDIIGKSQKNYRLACMCKALSTGKVSLSTAI
ncbi:2Fe-2S iron-sulfur cluster-binding protein [Photobacterium angustum]|nr:2Fe-2S iron-sulfur cluster-binding protein [Photobacterium angustum]